MPTVREPPGVASGFLLGMVPPVAPCPLLQLLPASYIPMLTLSSGLLAALLGQPGLEAWGTELHCGQPFKRHTDRLLRGRAPWLAGRQVECGDSCSKGQTWILPADCQRQTRAAYGSREHTGAEAPHRDAAEGAACRPRKAGWGASARGEGQAFWVGSHL